tara:strand:+ start:633 stop:1748 length:1116 start_codon:yes stop_codon:yes gene_type:complete
MLQRLTSLLFINFILLSINVSAQQTLSTEPKLDQDNFLYEAKSSGNNVVVNQGDTLWSIASNLRLDLKVTMSQMMLAIFNENPDAFKGNVNILKKNSTLHIPFADEVFQINIDFAFDEIQRQHARWAISFSNNLAFELQQDALTTESFKEQEITKDSIASMNSEYKLKQQNKILNIISEDSNLPDQTINDHEFSILKEEANDSDLEIKEIPTKNFEEVNLKKENKLDPVINIIINDDLPSTGEISLNANSIEKESYETPELIPIWIIVISIVVVLFGVSWFMRSNSSIEYSAEKNPASHAEVADIAKPKIAESHLSNNNAISIVGTKLDLARAYVDMGDLVKALKILEEVLDEGNELQKREAKGLLNNITD